MIQNYRRAKSPHGKYLYEVKYWRLTDTSLPYWRIDFEFYFGNEGEEEQVKEQWEKEFMKKDVSLVHVQLMLES